MSLLSRFFYKRPPDGLLEFIDRIYGKLVKDYWFVHFYTGDLICLFSIPIDFVPHHVVQFLIHASAPKFCRMECTLSI
jgi:hypothetical protein